MTRILVSVAEVLLVIALAVLTAVAATPTAQWPWTPPPPFAAVLGAPAGATEAAGDPLPASTPASGVWAPPSASMRPRSEQTGLGASSRPTVTSPAGSARDGSCAAPGAGYVSPTPATTASTVASMPRPAVGAVFTSGIMSWEPCCVAIPQGPGWRVRLCSLAHCWTGISTDAGPDLAMQRAGRVADVPPSMFEYLSGFDRTRGLAPATVELLGRT